MAIMQTFEISLKGDACPRVVQNAIVKENKDQLVVEGANGQEVAVFDPSKVDHYSSRRDAG